MLSDKGGSRQITESTKSQSKTFETIQTLETKKHVHKVRFKI